MEITLASLLGELIAEGRSAMNNWEHPVRQRNRVAAQRVIRSGCRPQGPASRSRCCIVLCGKKSTRQWQGEHYCWDCALALEYICCQAGALFITPIRRRVAWASLK